MSLISSSINNVESLLVFIKENIQDGNNLTIRGLARLCDVHKDSIILSGDFKSEKLGQKLTGYGFDAGDLVENGFDAKATWLVIEYFAYESKAKALGAKQLARTFGQLGVQMTFDKLTETQAVAQQPLPRQLPPVRDYIDHLNATEAIKRVDNPILRSLLEQAQMEHLSSGRALPGSREDDLVIAAVLARDLGYTLEKGQDSRLGKWVKKYHEPKGKAQHGRYEVNVYKRSEIEDTVHAFFR